MGMSSVTRLYSVGDVRALPDDGNRYEVIAGELFVTPAPGGHHQTVLGRLYLLLGNYVEWHAIGQLWFAPLDVVFGPMTLVEPDLLFLHRSRRGLLAARDLPAAPDLAVEVVAPSSARTDRCRKRALYQDEGVTEYWVVDLEARQVEVWRPGATAAQVHRETITWQPDPAVEPLVIALPEVFRDL